MCCIFALLIVAGLVWRIGVHERPNPESRAMDRSEPKSEATEEVAQTTPLILHGAPLVFGLRPKSYRLASWNINFGNQQVEQVAAELEKADADIVCLQETTRQSEDFLVSAMKGRYPHYQSFGHQGNYYAERFLVLSKEPWKSIRYVPPVRRFFGSVVMETEFNEAPVQIVSVHLAPFTANGVQSLAGLYSAMGETEVDHQHEIQAILESVSVKAPVVILGDFNSLAGMVAPRMLRDAGFIDAFEKLESNADQTHRTWHWPIQGGGELRLRIDYVFHSTHFKPKNAHVVPCTHSDHDLLVVDFSDDLGLKGTGMAGD